MHEVYDPPEIEKILDTTLAKNNERYYKVKWVKVTWEAESDLVYFENIIEQFWAEYTHESLLIHPPSEPVNGVLPDDECGVPNIYHNVNKDVPSETTFTDTVSTNSITLPQHSVGDATIEDLPKEICLSAELTERNNADPSVFAEPSPCSSLVTTEDIVSIQSKATTVLCNPEKVKCKVTNKHKLMKSTPRIKATSLTGEEALYTETISREFPFKCHVCNATFKNKELVGKHVNGHTSRTCKVCNKEFQRIGHLKAHYLTHSNTRPWSCDDCDKSFTEKSSLKKHKLIHSGLKPHKCDLCTMSFRRTGHLRRHVDVVHKNVRYFSCDVCGKTFYEKATYTTHMNVHSGKKPFPCSVCTRPFADKSALSRHMSIHTGKKPHKCQHCEKTFPRLSSLKSHLKRKHKPEENVKILCHNKSSTSHVQSNSSK